MEHGLTGLFVPDYSFEHKSRGSHSLSILPFLLHLHALLPPLVLRLLWFKVRELNPPQALTNQCFTMVQDEGQRWLEANARSTQGLFFWLHLLTSTLIHWFQGKHTNTSFSCSAQPTLWPLIYFALNRHYCPKEHGLKLVQFWGKNSGFFSNSKMNIRILHC